jgi:hypothetical protein
MIQPSAGCDHGEHVIPVALGISTSAFSKTNYALCFLLLHLWF